MARIYLTGRMVIEGPDGVVDEAQLPGVQGRVALAFLVLARGPVSRDLLAEAVWEGKELPTGWDKALNPIVSKLRGALSRAGIDGKDTLASGTGAVELRRHDDISVDFEQCVTAVDATEGALRQGDIPTAWANAAIGASIARRPDGSRACTATGCCKRASSSRSCATDRWRYSSTCGSSAAILDRPPVLPRAW